MSRRHKEVHQLVVSLQCHVLYHLYFITESPSPHISVFLDHSNPRPSLNPLNYKRPEFRSANPKNPRARRQISMTGCGAVGISLLIYVDSISELYI